jgi:predicted flap endonuclease-1-like 5' DNA nuclease
VPESQNVPPQADDLKRIVGIGPKIADTLNAAGVQTFAQLTQMTVDELDQLMKEGGIRIAYPDTWPEQAALAAAGDWQGLEALTRSLVRGRRA